jgi:Peptidase_C39 like family/Tetratricopeptide repeat
MRFLSGTSGTKARCSAGLFVLCGLLSGCTLLAPQTIAVATAPPPGLALSADLSNVPYFAQTEHHCGPAALAMALNSAGANVTPAQLADQVYLPGRQGSLQVEMLAAARRNGMVAYVLQPDLGHVLLEVNAGTPVITLENHGVALYPVWHYAVAIGFDLQGGDLIRHSGTVERKRTPLSVFEYYWRAEGRWAMVAVPPERVPVTATESRYAEAVIALEKAGQVQRAAIAYQAMLRRWPSNLVALMGLGNTAHAQGDLALAEASFRQAAAAHTGAVAAHNNLAQTLLERGKLEEARAAAERAVSLGGPLNARAQATLDAIRNRQRAP